MLIIISQTYKNNIQVPFFGMVANFKKTFIEIKKFMSCEKNQLKTKRWKKIQAKIINCFYLHISYPIAFKIADPQAQVLHWSKEEMPIRI